MGFLFEFNTDGLSGVRFLCLALCGWRAERILPFPSSRFLLQRCVSTGQQHLCCKLVPPLPSVKKTLFRLPLYLTACPDGVRVRLREVRFACLCSAIEQPRDMRLKLLGTSSSVVETQTG